MHLDADQAKEIASGCFAVGTAAYHLWKDRRKKKAEIQADESAGAEDAVTAILKEELAYVKAELAKCQDDNAKKDAQIANLYNALDSGFRRGKGKTLE